MHQQPDTEHVNALYRVDGLYSAVKQYHPATDEATCTLLMEFLLHGLAEFSLISKKQLEPGGFSFGDMLGSMLNMGTLDDEDI